MAGEIPAILSSLTPLLPEIIAFIKGLRSQQNPSDPPLTDAQVLAALQALVVSTIQVDENWKVAHPQ